MRLAALALLGLLAAARPAIAEPEKARFEFKDATLAEAAAAVAKAGEARVIVDPKIAEVRVSLTIEEPAVEKALAQLAAAAGKEYEAVPAGPPGRYLVRPRITDPKVRVEDRLDRARVELDFDATPLPEVLEFLAGRSGVAIYLDPGLVKERDRKDLAVSLKSPDVSAKEALDLLSALRGLKWEVRWGLVFVSSPERLNAVPRHLLPPPAGEIAAWEKRLRARLDERLAWNLAAVSVPEALDFLRMLTGLNIILADPARERAAACRVHLAEEATIGEMLAAILLPHGFSARLKDGVVYVE